jgi:hypothetical protein
MKWEFVRRGLVVAGVLYLVILIPTNIRPSWNQSPLRKPSQTITVAAQSAAGALPADFGTKLKNACKPSWALRPLMSSATKVTVLLTWNANVITTRSYKCAGRV